jgi:hypothetical protein
MKVAVFASLLIVLMMSMEQSFGSTLLKFEMTEESVENKEEYKENVRCPDGTICPGLQTCCLAGIKYRCCPIDYGVCCPGGLKCCPPGYHCVGDDCYPNFSFQSLIASLPTKEKTVTSTT